MRKQRFAYTLPAQDDFVLPPEQDDAKTIFQSQFSLQDPMWSQIFAAPEIEPVYMYQYPVIQIPPSQFQSVSSILSSPGFQMNPYENYNPFGHQMPIETNSFANSPPISDSGYGDCVIPEMYAREEPEFQFDDDFYANLPSQELLDAYPVVTKYGTVTILLRHLIRVDVSADKSIFLTNLPADCAAVVNSKGDRSGVIHPNGKVFHEVDDVHMMTLNKRAKISKRGIVFTSSDHCLSFLVDASGTKTTSEKFRDLNQDFSRLIFNGDSTDTSMEICCRMAEEAVHKTYRNGDEVWIVGGLRIKQDQWGDVKISRNYGRQVIRASPTTGRMSISTNEVDITVGRYHNNYFIVRKGNQVVTASLRGFHVQSGTQKSGFNRTGKLVIK